MASGIGQHDVLNDLQEFTATLKGSRAGMVVDRTSIHTKESFKRRSNFKESPVRLQASSKQKLVFTDRQTAADGIDKKRTQSYESMGYMSTQSTKDPKSRTSSNQTEVLKLKHLISLESVLPIDGMPDRKHGNDETKSKTRICQEEAKNSIKDGHLKVAGHCSLQELPHVIP